MEEIIVTIKDAGPMGAELHSYDRPDGCPGMGGWKFITAGSWMTRIKGPEASRLLDIATDAPDGVVTLMMDGDNIVDVQI